MSTCRVCPARAPRTATGPVHMWPGIIRRMPLLWIAGNAGGTTNGGTGIRSGVPETDDKITRSPLSMVASGSSPASKNPQWTVSGPASIRSASIVFSLSPCDVAPLQHQLSSRATLFLLECVLVQGTARVLATLLFPAHREEDFGRVLTEFQTAHRVLATPMRPRLAVLPPQEARGAERRDGAGADRRTAWPASRSGRSPFRRRSPVHDRRASRRSTAAIS